MKDEKLIVPRSWWNLLPEEDVDYSEMYEASVKEGFKGTFVDFLESLKCGKAIKRG